MADDLPTIDPEQLAQITGGATSSDQQLQVMLQSLMSSIKELAAGQNNNGNDSFMQILPFIMMMKGRQGSAPPPPPPPPAPTPPLGDGWVRVR